MTLQEFVNKYTNQKLDYDNAYGAQCTDVVKYWVANCGLPITHGNAIDYDKNADGNHYIWVANTPSGIPSAGDIVVWDLGIGSQYGHVAIFLHGDTYSFTSFDQNFPLNSACHQQTHSYKAVKGWLHLPSLNAPTPAPAPAPEPVPTVDPKDAQITSLSDNLAKANVQIDGLNSQITNLQGQVDNLTDQLKSATTGLLACQNQTPAPVTTDISEYSAVELFSFWVHKLFNIKEGA